MNKRILLINPPTGLYRRDDRCQNAVKDQTVRVILPPMVLSYIAALYREAGYTCKIADYPAENKNFEDLKEDLLSFKPDILYLGITTATIEKDIEAARLAKELNPDILNCSFGFYFRTYGIEIMEKYEALDIVIFSEAEGVVKELIEKADLSEVKGIIYRKEGIIVKNPDYPGTENPDIFPFPARDLLKNELYVSPDNGKPLGVITTSRGCPFKCIFCPAGTLTNYKVFHRSAENIFNEIKECHEKYSIDEFLLNADTFTARKKIVLELCRLIRESSMNITWAANSRVDTVDEEMLLEMKRSSCKMVAFGIESGSQDMLDKMKKGIRKEQARNAIALCKKAELLSHTFYIIGLPWETRETLSETLNFVREIDADFFDFNVAYPLPGTELFEIAKKDNLFDESKLRESSYATSQIHSYKLSSDELIKFRKNALLRLYLRPSYIMKTLKRVLFKPAELKRYISFGFKRLRQLF